MNLSEYCQYDGLGLAKLVLDGKITANELTALAIKAAEAVNPQINAIIEIYDDVGSDHAIGSGQFQGVPFLRKDLFTEEAGRLNENGSRLWKGYRSKEDSWLTTKFRQSGVNIIGRTTTPEMGLSGSTESLHTGKTRNPYNLELMAGGSSGGSAAAVAARVVPMAHASDGAGSIRIPASCCNLVGLKPSRGRVNAAPPPGVHPYDFAVNFVVSRSVRDSAAMLDALQGSEPGAYVEIIQPERSYLEELNRPIKPLKIAFTHAQWGPMPTEPELVKLTQQTAIHLEQQGHHVTEDTIHYDYDEYLHAMVVLWSIGMDVFHDESAAMFGRKVDETTLEAVTLAQYHWAKTLTMNDYQRSIDVINRVNRQSALFFEKYDLLLTPTLGRVPQPIDYYSQDNRELDFQAFFRRCDDSMAYMPLANFTGQPAVSLPLGMSSAGLPLGMQFMSKFGDEATLLRLAAHFEQAMPWQQRVPDIRC